MSDSGLSRCRNWKPYDGRLSCVPGMGKKRIRGIREALAGRFRRPPISACSSDGTPAKEPPISQLLDVDREYRQKAKADQLPRIAPQRLNPTGEPWLPVLHTQRGSQHYTALYSNTASAHELEMTRDWVVIYRDDHAGHGQWTAITARYGPLRNRRIIRGREAECQTYYSRQKEKNRDSLVCHELDLPDFERRAEAACLSGR